MRWILMALVCLLVAYHLAVWPFAPRHAEALAVPNGDSIGITVQIYYPREGDLQLRQVLATRACGSFADLLSQSNVLRAQMEAVHPVSSGIVMVVVTEPLAGRGGRVIYRSGDLTRKETATDATLLAMIQADACGIMGDTRSQAIWLQLLDIIKQLQNAEKRPKRYDKETALEL